MVEDRIQKQIDAGRRYLVVELEDEVAMLGSEQDVFRRSGGSGLVQFLAVDIGELYRQFSSANNIRERTEFTLADLAQLAGVKNHVVNYWISEGVLTPSISGRTGKGNERKFGRADAFCAGLIGSLHRKGLPLSLLMAAAKCLTDTESHGAPRKNKIEPSLQPLLK